MGDPPLGSWQRLGDQPAPHAQLMTELTLLSLVSLTTFSFKSPSPLRTSHGACLTWCAS